MAEEASRQTESDLRKRFESDLNNLEKELCDARLSHDLELANELAKAKVEHDNAISELQLEIQKIRIELSESNCALAEEKRKNISLEQDLRESNLRLDAIKSSVELLASPMENLLAEVRHSK